jgi:DNA-binding transcriptional MocR family regulator
MPYIPDSVFESKAWEKLSLNSRLVYVALCKFYNRKERKAFPGISRIMQVSGCSRRSVFRALNELKEKGLIVIKKRDSTGGFDSNMYILLDFLFFELNQTKEASARQALASDIQALLSATAGTPLVPDSHPNYIINHITNITNSFNSKEPKATDDPEKYHDLLSQRLAEYWKDK